MSPGRSPATPAGATASTELAGLAADSRTVAAWTLVSRITGFGRVATIAAVFGPTYFGNLVQTSMVLPNVVHELLTGSLITAMLVPPLVRAVDLGDPASVRRLAGGFLGVAMLIFGLVVVLGILAAPLVVSLMTAAVGHAAIRDQQQAVGWPLLAMMMPQILLYGIIATAVAVQHAHRRFALPAAAPALENLVVMAVMAASALIFGVGTDVGAVTMPQLLLLGLGSTAAVAVHAAAQWCGAARAGVRLVPQPGWRDPEVRRIVRLAIPSSGYAALNGGTFFGLLVAAGSVPGGAVAFQIGLNFFNLPVALCARPVAAAQLPRLARSFNDDRPAAFHATYRRSLALTLFVALPASLLFLGIPEALARAVSFGEMAAPAGVALVAAAIASLGPGVSGEAAFLVSTSASYARRDAVSPLRAMALRAALTAAGMAVALVAMDGIAVLWTLGLAASVGYLAAAGYLYWRQLRALPVLPDPPGLGLLAGFAAAAVAVAPALLIVRWLGDAAAAGYRQVGVAILALLASGLVYLALQWAAGSAELRSLLGGLRDGRREGSAPGDARLAADERQPGVPR